mmetsp:Transcript_39758/g.86573  ORF Transcript_39758/g.86573 Transcript_39758/m.86573 type:complete len:271 (+) Transcript_39758:644-1456(+)
MPLKVPLRGDVHLQLHGCDSGVLRHQSEVPRPHHHLQRLPDSVRWAPSRHQLHRCHLHGSLRGSLPDGDAAQGRGLQRGHFPDDQGGGVLLPEQPEVPGGPEAVAQQACRLPQRHQLLLRNQRQRPLHPAQNQHGGGLLQVLHGPQQLPLFQPRRTLQPLVGGHRVLTLPANGLPPDCARGALLGVRGDCGVRDGAVAGLHLPLHDVPATHQRHGARRPAGGVVCGHRYERHLRLPLHLPVGLPDDAARALHALHAHPRRPGGADAGRGY